MFFKTGVLKNSAKFAGKHLCWSLFFNKVAGLRPATLFKKRLQHRYFPVNIAKFSRSVFLYITPPAAASAFTRSQALRCSEKLSKTFVTIVYTYVNSKLTTVYSYHVLLHLVF